MINVLFLLGITLTSVISGVLKGEPGEVASAIQFKPEFENGALLTVVLI